MIRQDIDDGASAPVNPSVAMPLIYAMKSKETS